MTKQEQIEEMAKLIKAEYKQWLDTTGVIPEGTTYYAECLGCAIDCAKSIYEAVYHKIREKDETLEERKGLKAEIKHLNTIAERLDELLWKGIDKYIKGIDGVEGLKDMWERSAVREFAEKLKAKSEMFLVAKSNGVYGEKPYVAIEKIDERLKEYE